MLHVKSKRETHAALTDDIAAYRFSGISRYLSPLSTQIKRPARVPCNTNTPLRMLVCMMSEAQREQKRKDSKQLTDYTIARVEGDTPHAAALAAGYSPTQARNATKVIEPRVRSTIREYLDEHGATRQDVAAAIGRALVATKPSKHGTYEDSATQLAAGRFVAELHGETKAQAGGSSISVTLSGPLAEAFMQRMQGQVIDAE